ncbi:MAG: class I SAM-dependent methyltransferase [Candidatus Hydrogenedentes bacterium]|nr:class I SAM-dependent methyltransferase [Candidatus Hydrogenedentota bacterium]
MKTRFSHWSLRYLWDRSRLYLYELTHPEAPWLTPQAVAFLESWLQPDHVGLEWGSGRSTLWFASRVDRLISIEHDPAWYAHVQNRLLARPRNNVTLILADSDSDAYYAPARELPNGSLDFALVDGVSATRDRCAECVLPKIRPGGILIIDDIHRYLPSGSRAPRAVPLDGDAASETWTRVADAVADWELIETTSGVTDTAILRRPAAVDSIDAFA